MRSNRWRAWKAAAPFFLNAVALLSKNEAASLTWDGGGADSDLGTAANWTTAQAPVNGDALIFAGANSLAPILSSNLTVASLTFNNTAGAFMVGGTGRFTINSGVTNNSTASQTIATNVSLAAAQNWNAASGPLVMNGAVDNKTFLLTINGANATTIGGVITGTGGLTKSGAGTLTLGNSNSYSGTTTLTAGVISLAANQALGSGTLLLNGGTLQANTAGVTLGNAVTHKADSTINGTQALTFTGVATDSGNRTLTINNTGGVTFAGEVRLSDSKNSRTLTIAGTGISTISSVISNGNIRAKTSGLTKTGTGTLTLNGSASNTFGGALTVNGGTLRLGKTNGATAVPKNLTIGDNAGTDTVQLLGNEQISDSSVVTLNSAGLFDLNGFAERVGAISGSGTIVFNGGTLTTGGLNTSTTLSGQLSGSGGLVKIGTGTLTLTGTANSAGFARADGGTVVIGATGASSSSTVLGATGTGIVSLGAISTTAGGLSLVAGRVQSTTGILTLVGDSTATSSGGTSAVVAGLVALSGQRTFTVASGGSTVDLNFSALISGTGGLIKAGSGTMLLSAANTYSGGTTINGGTLRISGGNAVADNSAIVLANAAATLDLANSSEVIGSLAGGGLAGGSVTLGSGTLTVGGINASTTFGGSISGTGGLIKNGTGVLTLTGANTFTGPITINAGSVKVSGGAALSDTGAVSLANVPGAALELIGTAETIGSITGGGALGGNVILTNGTLTVGANNTSTIFAGGVSGAGNLAKTGTGTLTFTSANSFTGQFTALGGTTTLSGGGAMDSIGKARVENGAILSLDNSVTNQVNRIGDAALIELDGGILRLISGATGLSESVGTLQATGGNSQIEITHNGGVSTSTRLTFSSLGTFTPGATINFAATGGTLGAGTTGPQVYITGLAPGFIGGWATVGSDFAEYSTYGIRALTGYYSGPEGININDPALIPILTSGSSTAARTLTRAGTTNDKSLNLQDVSTVDLGSLSTNTLNLASGGLIKSTAVSTAISGAGRLTAGNVTAGNLALTIDAASTLTVSSAIINNAGANGTYGDADDGIVSLAKGGGGTLVLEGSNTYTGSNFLNSGITRVSSEGNLGALSNGVTFNGGTLEVTTGFTTSAAKVFTVNAGASGIISVALGEQLSLAPVPNVLRSGDGASALHKTGAGKLAIAAANPNFIGELHLDGGSLELTAAGAIGGTVKLNGGSLNLRSNADAAFATSASVTADSTIDVARAAGSSPTVILSLGALSIGANTLTTAGSGSATLAFDMTTLTGNATFSTGAARLRLGAITGTYGFSKNGSGILTLAGANSHTGATNVLAGTLQVGLTNATSPDSAIALSAGAVFDVNGFNTTVGSLAGTGYVILGTGMLSVGADGNSGSYAGVISGSGGLTKVGTGTLTLTGANTYTGTTFVNGGTLVLSGSGGVISDNSALTVASTATLSLNNIDETVDSLAGAGDVALGSGFLTISGSSSTSYSGAMSGTGGLVKSGTGTLILSGASAYSGTTTIAAGVLNLQDDSALGAATGGTVVGIGGQLEVEGGLTVAAEPLTLNGAGVTGAGALRNVSGLNTWSGPITLGSGTTIAADSGILSIEGTLSKGTHLLTVGGAGTIILEGEVGGSTGLTKFGTGTVVLSSPNTYSGTTTVSAGTLNVLDAGSLGASGAGNGSTVAAGASIRIDDDIGITISGEALTLNGLGVGGAGALISGSGANAWAGAISLATDSNISVEADSLTVSGVIDQGAATRSLTKEGTGILILNATNTYGGTTSVNQGTLTIGSSGGLASSAVIVGGDGILTVQTGGVLSASVALTLSGSADFNGATAAIGTLNGTGTLTLNGTTISIGAGTFSGAIKNGASAGGLSKTGPGTLVLTGGNSYSGNTTISQGTLAVDAEASLGAGTSVVLNGGSLRADAAISLAKGVSLGALGGTIDTNGNVVVLTGSISGSSPLIKAGLGTLAVASTPNSAFSGGILANAGTLRITGAINSAVTVASGATLDGSGSTGAVTASVGGTIEPGVGIGTLSTLSFTLASGAQLRLEIGGTTGGSQYDQLNVTGTVNLGGSLQLSLLNGFTPTTGDRFFPILNDGTDAISGQFAGIAQGGTVNLGGHSFIIGYTGNSLTNSFTGGNDVVFQAMPEPSSAAIFLLGGIGLLGFRRRREG